MKTKAAKPPREPAAPVPPAEPQAPAALPIDVVAETGDASLPLREQRIREAAYRRYEQRGGADGDAHRDWLDAEAEIDGVDQASSSNEPS